MCSLLLCYQKIRFLKVRHDFYRGSDATDTLTKLSSVLKSIAEMLEKNKMGCPQKQNADVDAFSFQITCTGLLTSYQRKVIIDFLEFFGKENSAISIPKTTGPTKKDGIFGTPGSETIHLDEWIREGEALVTGTPVKFAIPEECKEKLAALCRKKDWPMTAANRRGICFEPLEATNTPSYGELVDAILTSCYHDGRFFLHVANLGTRLNIITNDDGVSAQEGNNSLVELFVRIKKVRNAGLTLSMSQLDIAFKATISPSKLIQMSYEKKSNNKRKTEHIYQDESVFPVHTIDLEKTAKEQRGTLRMKRRLLNVKEGKTSKGTMEKKKNTSFGECDDNSDKTYQDGFYFMAEQLKCEDGLGKTDFNVHKNDVYSSKLYSSRFTHTILQDRSKISDLLEWKGMDNIWKRTFGQLKRKIMSVWNSHKRGIEATEESGSVLRFEISIRPEQGSPLRESGHLVDLLLHVHLAIWSLFEQYRIHIHHLEPKLVQAKMVLLINQTYELLCGRDSRHFNDQWQNKKYHYLLQFLISTIIATAGYGLSYGLKYQRRWYKDQQKLDPHNMGPQVTHETFLLLRVNVSQIVSDTSKIFPPTNLVIFLEDCGMSTDGAEAVIEYCKRCLEQKCMQRNSESGIKRAMDCFKTLTLYDKNCLVSNLESHVIPYLTRSLNEQDDEVEFDEEEGGEVGEDRQWVAEYEDGDEEDCMNDESDHICDIPSSIPDNDPIMEFSIRELGIVANDVPVNDPSIATIQALAQLLKSVNVANIIPFHTNLFKYIVSCHQHGVVLPGQSCQLGILSQKAIHLLEPQECSPNSKVWKNLCKELKANQNNTVCTRNDQFMRALCLLYCFPCPGIEFKRDPSVFNAEHAATMNKELNDILALDTVSEIHHLSRSHGRTYHRNTESSNILILYPDRLIKDIDPPPIFEMVGNAEGLAYMTITNYLKITITKASDIKFFRDELKKNLLQRPGIRNCFLNETGETHAMFKDIDTVEQFEDRHNYPLSGQNSVQRRMNPNLILPIISLLYDMDILFYDHSQKRTTLYVSHSKDRVIIYEKEGINIVPQIKAATFYFTVREQFLQCKVTPPNMILPGYQKLASILSSPLCSSSGTLAPLLASTKHNHFNDHPWNKKTSVRNTFKNFLTAAHYALSRKIGPDTLSEYETFCLEQVIEETTFYQNDRLHLTSFISELTDSKSLVFGENIPGACTQLFSEALCSHLRGQEDIKLPVTHENGNKALSPFLCLKHKVYVVLWLTTGSNRIKATELYYYDFMSEKIDFMKYTGFHFFPHSSRVIYIRCNMSISPNKYGYYFDEDTPKVTQQECINLMAHCHSFPHDDFMHCILAKLNDCVKVDGSVSHPVGANDGRTTVYPKKAFRKIRNGNFVFAEWFLISVFPPNKSDGKWPTYAIYFSESIKESIEEALQCFALQACKTQRPTDQDYRSHYNFNTYLAAQRVDSSQCTCESGFLVFLSAHIASKSLSFLHFEEILGMIFRERDLGKKLRHWSIRSATLGHLTTPPWLSVHLPIVLSSLETQSAHFN